MNANVILVPLDGSAQAEAALPYAEALGTAEHRKVRLFSVVETNVDGLFPQAITLSADLNTIREETADKALRRLANGLRTRGLPVETETVLGAAPEEIIRAGNREDVAAIVMATHGRGGAERWALGSVADKVMRGSMNPVLLVQSNGVGLPEPIVFQRLLVPLDGSPEAAAALEPASELALATGATVVLVRVVPDLTTLMNWGPNQIPELFEIEAELVADAFSALADVKNRLPREIHSEVVVLRGPPEEALEDYIREHRIDLTIMTTHGRGGFSRFILGSTADRLVRTGAPVLLLHSGARESVDQKAQVERRPASAQRGT